MMSIWNQKLQRSVLTIRRLFITPNTNTSAMLPNVTVITLDHHGIDIR
jgi:hypothetical protein